MNTLLERIAGSQPVQLVLAVLVYAMYAAVLGLCLAPPLAVALWGWQTWLPLGAPIDIGRVVPVGLSLGGAYFVFLMTSTVVMGSLVRLLTLGFKPGKYPKASVTTFRWLISSGITTLAYRLVLPLIPVSWFSNLFFLLTGCRMGKNCYLNAFMLNDAYLLELGDNVTIGGGAEISCHLWEHDSLILDRIVIGSGTLIGANCYIAPGVTIGENCVVGLGSYVRRGTRVPDGARLTRIGAISLRRAAELERGG